MAVSGILLGSGPYQKPPPRSNSIILSSLSWAYIVQARMSCLSLDLQTAPVAFNLALVKAGNSMAARMAMMAITTSSSIRVKPLRRIPFGIGAHSAPLCFSINTLRVLMLDEPNYSTKKKTGRSPGVVLIAQFRNRLVGP